MQKKENSMDEFGGWKSVKPVPVTPMESIGKKKHVILFSWKLSYILNIQRTLIFIPSETCLWRAAPTEVYYLFNLAAI